jgi:BNR/Asp-box repeat protein
MRFVRQPVLALVLALALVACGSGAGDGIAAPPGGSEPGVIHIHGLGINPEDGALFAAAHSGVYRISDGTADRVSRYFQDTMGFTVLGPDHFAGSGHPDLYDEALHKEGRPPNLGLVESTDAGQTWEEVSLLGEVDFHALSFAHGRVYGYDATGQRFMTSADRREWDTRSSAVELIDFAVSPEDPERIVAGDGRGVVQSTDGGRTWEPIGSGPALVFLDWTTSDGLVGVDAVGGVFVSSDGRSFAEMGELGNTPAALLVTKDAWYAGVDGGDIVRSDDGGETWQGVYEEDAQHSGP